MGRKNSVGPVSLTINPVKGPEDLDIIEAVGRGGVADVKGGGFWDKHTTLSPEERLSMGELKEEEKKKAGEKRG